MYEWTKERWKTKEKTTTQNSRNELVLCAKIRSIKSRLGLFHILQWFWVWLLLNCISTPICLLHCYNNNSAVWLQQPHKEQNRTAKIRMHTCTYRYRNVVKYYSYSKPSTCYCYQVKCFIGAIIYDNDNKLIMFNDIRSIFCLPQCIRFVHFSNDTI